ncbi:MAG: hypothetical protein K2J58_00250, partial [Muribaculaceae bacterium]|nr:hypothetical protein [Muribaculaceae bacterium]
MSNSDYPKVEDGKLVFDEINGVADKFEVKSGLGDIDQAKTYKIYLKSKGTENTKLRVLFGSNGANAVGYVDVVASTDVFTETQALLNDPIGQYNTIAKNSVLQLETRDASYIPTKGRVEIQSLRVAPNANEHVAWFTNGSGSAIPLNGYNDIQITDNGLQLNVQSKPLTCEVMNNLDLEANKSYSVDFEIQAAAGRYIIALGDGATSLTREIEITEKEANTYVKKHVNFGSNASESGSLTISPVGYTANLNVRNAQIIEYTPGFKQGDMIGTDFFEVELGDVKDNAPYILDKEGKYVFHIGYVTDGNDTPAAETPKSIMISASNSQNGTYTRLGLCELIEMKNGNAFFSTVNNPLKNIEDGSEYRYLRIYCVDNMGEETALCFPKTNGNYDTEHPYVGSMMRVNRFAIYKQSTMFATDKANPAIGTALNEETYDKYEYWAIPAITRFQIEALGQKYAYPGANLEDMLGVKKDTEVCGELFDNDVTGNNSARITYWDTTLPFVRDGERATQDKYQYLNYAGFNYPEEYNGNRNYDCIDLLLPDMKDLGAVKKYNGRITPDTDAKGYYQVVVSMGRSTGNMDTFSNRLNYNVSRTDTIDKKQVFNPDGTPKLDDDNKPIYEYTVNTIVSNETAAFVNRANGFPIEISYQGLKIDANHNKTAQLIGESERIITFPTVAAGDSIHFALKVEEGWDGVRIFCRENHGNLERRAGGSKLTNKAETDRWNVRVVDITNNDPMPGTRIMRLGEIRAYVELNKIDLETPEGRQRYDLLYNNREAFNTRKWRHTKGIIDDINNVNSVNNETTDLYMKKGDGGQTWEDVLNTYKDFFEEEGIEIPDFSLIDNPFDDEDVVPSNGMQRVYDEFKGQKRQRSYTILHEVLALPGERVDLYPQSDIWMRNGWNYEEQFVRWYDYLTDKAPDYLYFFAEPKSVIKTTDAGFIGGKTLLDHGLRGKGTVASLYFNTTNANTDWSYNDGGIERMKDQWVAADFSLAFNNKLNERLSRATGENEDTIHEPVINFRHLFHITSGSLFAERYMATAEGNRHYAKSNRRYISSFAGKTFRIRLDQAMPADAGTKSPFYYKTTQTNVKGEPVYERVRDYEIRTYKLGDRQTSDDLIKGIVYTTMNTGQVTDTIFKMDDSSIFDHIDSYVQTTTPSSRWLRNSKRFARAIKCRKEHTTKGRYLVRLYGKDADGNVIKLSGKDESGENDVEVPLVIAEYEVEFLDDEHASFISEDDIAKIGEGHRQEHHTEKYLDEHYSNGKSDVKVVDFDKYTILKSKNQIVDKNSAPVNFDRYGFFEYKTWGVRASRLKLPIAWGNSNYGFGYSSTGDYNMFRLADNSAITPYKTAADKRVNEYADPEYGTVQTGTYDRLFYNTGGKEKGLFYYVNAAADPGEMVKLAFDYLCPGSTIYVSAWVNEFNEGQPETANVIFNFFANVAKDVDGKKTILRQEQIHGFATGYVKKNPEDDYENGETTGGDQGKWMHVYYSFVPDPSHADVLAADGEYIDSYDLVLENNCLSSSGADYAIDDIRAYVVAPRVEAEQSNALCDKSDKKVDIKVMMPLEALETSLAGKVDPDGIVRLQYSMVDKVKYDEILDEKRKNLHGDQELSTDDYYDAFAQSVLHYKRDNVRVNAEGTLSEEPLSWGMIEFYMDYKNEKYKSDNDKITDSKGNILKINGEELTIGDYKKKYIETIEKEQCFVFTTHPVSDIETDYNDDFDNKHRNYYIVVDNIGTTGVFTSLFYEYDAAGNLVTDGNKNPVLKDEYKDKDINSIWNAAVYPSLAKKEEWLAYDKELAKAYQICTDCSRMVEFTLRSAALIVVDGVLHETDDNITCCENQRPVVQIDLKAKEKDKTEYSYDDLDVIDDSPLSENPYLDWWNGPFEEFAAQTSNIPVPGSTTGQKYTLWDVLDYFRQDYPNADTWNVPCVGERDAKGDLLPTGANDENGNLLKDKDGNPRVPENYTVEMRSYLAGFCATTKIDETTKETIPVEPKVVLHQSSFMFPQSETILVDKDGNRVKTKDIYVTAIPLSFPTLIDKEDGSTYVVCTQPREIKITVTNTSPTMFNGFKDITYPEAIEDVPLRIGLKQLDNIIAADATSAANTLYVPLRSVNPATFDVKAFKSVTEDTNVYLEETNDPQYRLISDYEKPGESVTDKNMYNVDRRIVGKVNSIVASFTKNTDGKIDINGVPMAQIVFLSEEKNTTKLPKGIEFREGYYYKFRFGFEEDTDGSDLYKQPGFEVPCKGQTVFSIKVVPEYQVWTGDSSLNWNNDDNWRRVHSKDDLMAAAANGLYGQDGKSRYTTDGNNYNKHSYAPLNFTKVIIPAGAVYPQLAPRNHSYTFDYDASVKTVNVNNGRLENNYKWAEGAPDAIPVKNMTDADNYNTGDHKEESNTQPTVYINYDMAAIMYNDVDIYKDDYNVYCRPWYANACEQIHFNSNAEILNQQNLDYEKAWVDMEMTPHRWYNVASPLYGVVAGDMYLPTEDAEKKNTVPGRQMTELFAPMTYDKALNDRFHPAVYQRGWDKGSEKVYNLEGVPDGSTLPGCPKVETVALASTWSHVYNDVTETYAPGVGVSVKTDATRLSNFQMKKVTNEDGSESEKADQSYVKFRFPKADESYNYFADDGSAENAENGGTLNRGDKIGKLYNFEVLKDKDGNDMAAGDV